MTRKQVLLLVGAAVLVLVLVAGGVGSCAGQRELSQRSPARIDAAVGPGGGFAL